MKKIMILALLLILTGCGNSCERNFKEDLTKNYSKDAKKCDVVKYTNKKTNLEVITTASQDKKTFTAKIKVNGYDLDFGYGNTQFNNLQIKQYNKINFLELYTNNKKINTYLVVFDNVGNIRYEVPASIAPVISGENFTVREYRLFVDGDLKCSGYKDLETIVYVEKTYNMMNMSLVNSKDVKIKDICK